MPLNLFARGMTGPMWLPPRPLPLGPRSLFELGPYGPSNVMDPNSVARDPDANRSLPDGSLHAPQLPITEVSGARGFQNPFMGSQAGSADLGQFQNPFAAAAQAVAQQQEQKAQNSGQRNGGTGMMNTGAKPGPISRTLQTGVGIPSNLAAALTTYLGQQQAVAEAEAQRAQQAQMAAQGAQQQVDGLEGKPAPRMGAGAEFTERLFGGMSQAIAPNMNGQALSENHIAGENERIKEQHLRRLQIMHQHADRLSQRAEQLGDYAGALKHETLKDKYAREFELQKYGDDKKFQERSLALQERVRTEDQQWRRMTTVAEGHRKAAERFESQALSYEKQLESKDFKGDRREYRSRIAKLRAQASERDNLAQDMLRQASGLKTIEGTSVTRLRADMSEAFSSGARWEDVAAALTSDGHGPGDRAKAKEIWEELAAQGQPEQDSNGLMYNLGQGARKLDPNRAAFGITQGIGNFGRGVAGLPPDKSQYADPVDVFWR